MNGYEFITASGETCSITIMGEYADGLRDVDVCCGGYCREWDEVDSGYVEGMFADLLKSGARFETKRSLVANIYTVESVMLERDSTIYDVLNKVEAMIDDEIEEKLDFGSAPRTSRRRAERSRRRAI